jgi:predicted transcriptional regulator
VLDALICSKGHGLTVDELCAALFPDGEIAEKHRQSVRRALRNLASVGELKLVRKGKVDVGGWRYIVRCVVA